MNTHRFLLAALVSTTTFAIIACGGSDESSPASDTAQAPLACNDSPLVGRYLWNVGNCETGMITVLSAESCETTLCGANAKTAEECDDTHTVQVPVDGLNLDFGGPDYDTRLERHIDCDSDPEVYKGEFAPGTGQSLSHAKCEYFNCLAENFDFFVGRWPGRSAPDGQLHPDSLWMLLDEPWPGKDVCRDSPTLSAFFEHTLDVCAKPD